MNLIMRLIKKIKKEAELDFYKDTKIKVYNDGELVHDDNVEKFLIDNQYDELVIDLCEQLKEKNEVEYDDNHSGYWLIIKIDEELNNVKVRVYNDEEEVFVGTVGEFLETNEYDGETMDMCNELKEKDRVEYKHLHSGDWVIEKI